MPRVAVVIPTYNRAAMLGDALASLDAQDEPCEVYVYDDGSEDDTARVARKHGACYIRAEHGGSVTISRNRAIAWALSKTQAPYIASLDSDDALARDAVRLKADHLDSHPDCGLVFTGLRFVSASRWKSKRGIDRRIDVSRYTPGDFSTFDRNVATGTVAFRRECWIPWREEIRLGGADLLWVYEQVTRGIGVGYIDKPLYYLRKHEGRNIYRWRGTEQAARDEERTRYIALVEAIGREHGYGA